MAKEEALSRHVDIADPTDDIAENEENCHGLDHKDSPVLMLLYGIQVGLYNHVHIQQTRVIEPM